MTCFIVELAFENDRLHGDNKINNPFVEINICFMYSICLTCYNHFIYLFVNSANCLWHLIHEAILPNYIDNHSRA